MLFYFDTASNKSRIADWVKKSETCGTMQDLHTKSEDRPSHSGRPRTHLDEVVDMVPRVCRTELKTLALSEESIAECLL